MSKTGPAVAKCLLSGLSPMEIRARRNRHGLLTAMLSAVALTLPATGGAGAETRLLVNCFAPPQHVMCRDILPAWKDNVEKATAKRVTIEFPAKSMAPPPAQWESVTKGVFDGALQFNGFIAKQVVGPRVAMSPFVAVLNAEAMSVALWRTYEKFMADKGEYNAVQLLGLFTAPGADFYSMNDAPIASVEAIKRRKMWALPGTVANLVKETGAPVVSGPAVQMLEIISKGVVDGYAGVPVSSPQEFKLVPYTKSVTFFKAKIFQPSFSFFVNEKKWARSAWPTRPRRALPWARTSRAGPASCRIPSTRPTRPKFWAPASSASMGPRPSWPSSRRWASPPSMRGSSGSAAWASTARRRWPTTSRCSARHPPAPSNSPRADASCSSAYSS
ncbi:MAG: hypothetical protein HC868_14720 [Sphingomonadales bacterium]|nr:hypothetical protein [Sphingomonadales bacterium]